MKLLFVADGRSPIALNWIQYFVHKGHEVHLVSLYPCQPKIKLASLSILPVAFLGTERPGKQDGTTAGKVSTLRRLTSPAQRATLRHWLVPLRLSLSARHLSTLIDRFQPDLIHAVRIPYEGMVAALALKGRSSPPLLVSIWGNDLTLHAPTTPLMANFSRQALKRADGLHTDNQRDQRLARNWGFPGHLPAIVLPGGGGIHPEIFYPPVESIQPVQPTVVNPRGMRAYVRNDIFFKAVPLVLDHISTVRFLCPAMSDQPEALRWVKRLGVENTVDLLPRLSPAQMGERYRQAQVAVSLSTHDGTPNTMLEGMACGCFPIVGDLESLREWITPGVNGFLVAPNDIQRVAEAIISALEQTKLRTLAVAHNARLIERRAIYGKMMPQAEAFYRELRI